MMTQVLVARILSRRRAAPDKRERTSVARLHAETPIWKRCSTPKDLRIAGGSSMATMWLALSPPWISSSPIPAQRASKALQ